MPNSRLHVLPGVLHQPQVERPEDVATFIDDFIADSTDHSFIPARPRVASRVVHIDTSKPAKRSAVRRMGRRRTKTPSVHCPWSTNTVAVDRYSVGRAKSGDRAYSRAADGLSGTTAESRQGELPPHTLQSTQLGTVSEGDSR